MGAKLQPFRHYSRSAFCPQKFCLLQPIWRQLPGPIPLTLMTAAGGGVGSVVAGPIGGVTNAVGMGISGLYGYLVERLLRQMGRATSTANPLAEALERPPPSPPATSTES